MPVVSNELRNILTFDDLIQYLEEKLDWPLHEYGFDELTFEYLPEELGLKDIEAAKIGRIHQLRPLSHSQPWGIFFVEFEKKKLPVVVLRRILSHLVLKKRASANKSREAAWDTEDLLFITAFGEVENEQREIAFAHFHQTPGDLPTLRVLGWDGADTPLKLAHVDTILRGQLLWPDNPSDREKWRQQWRKPFKHRIGHVINTASTLAEVLAVLARGIRDRALRMLSAESERGPLRKLHKAFQTSLVHDLTEESFADTYAQTITYGLLTAAISRTDDSKQRTETFIADNLHDLVPITNPFLREMLQTFLKVGGRKGGIDFDELGIQDVVDLLRGDETDLPAILRDFGNRTRGEDPVIHFYEHFLATYNKKLKIQRGAFYTPQPVVSYIIRSVDELLQTEFGIEDGLASTVTWGEMKQQNPDMTIPAGTSPESPFVMILDIATGTGTFLVEVIDVIHKTMTIKWQNQKKREQEIVTLWNEYVPKHLLPRLYGYELMMAPYAIAHMKIGLKLFETGYLFESNERVRIYLTNTLEPAGDVQQTLAGVIPALAHEAQAVNEVKRSVRFTVVVGNPPYSNVGRLNRIPFILELLDTYKQGLKEKKLNLDDDFIKFIRFAHSLLQCARTGCLGFITNNAYLDGVTHRGMRRSLLSTFPSTRILDLHGSVRKGDVASDGNPDKNVFDIQQGVAIAILSTGLPTCSQRLRYAELRGSREEKNRALSESQVAFAELSPEQVAAEACIFVPQDLALSGEYALFESLVDLFLYAGQGIQTKQDSFALQDTAAGIRDVISDVACLSARILSEKYDIPMETPSWSIAWAKKDVANKKGVFLRVVVAPFDWKWTYYTGHSNGFLARPRRKSTDMMLSGNIAIVAKRQTKERNFSSIFVVNAPANEGLFSIDPKGRETLFPLYLDAEGNVLYATDSRPINRVARLPYEAEGFIRYIYAVLHSPEYRYRYAGFLKVDFPRVPLPGNPDLFCDLARLGGQLVALHLLESPAVNNFITRYTGIGDNSIPKKPTWKDNAVWINSTQRFEGVPEAVWNFHIGGYQVCEKWLKDRKGRTLSDDDITHYQRIIVALSETIRVMGEIDEAINAHGGWPGAFQDQKKT